MEGLLEHPWMLGEVATYEEFKVKYDEIMEQSMKIAGEVTDIDHNTEMITSRENNARRGKNSILPENFHGTHMFKPVPKESIGN